MKRREFLQLGLWLSSGVLSQNRFGSQSPFGPSTDRVFRLSPANGLSSAGPTPPELRPYVDPLPIPPVIALASRRTVSIRMKEFYHKAHRDLKPARVWGYNGMWPGPTFNVNSGEPLIIKWINKLPTRHFLPIDRTLHGADSDVPEVRTVVHLHGAQVLPESDGYPEAWFTSDGKRGPAYKSGPYHYPNCQPAATLWYHDHAIGISRLNVYAGLAGFYLIHDKLEDGLNLPSDAYDIPLMVQDRRFGPDGSLVYPVAQNGTHPVWLQEFFGDVNCVNGKVSPYLDVEPRKYRFRMLNASNSRFYHLKMLPSDAEGNVAGELKDAPPFHQIGTDVGLLETPMPLRFLTISPAERIDMIIDFSEHGGKNLVMVNDAPAPYPRAGNIVPGEVLLFRVTKPLSATDHSALPRTLVPVSALNPSEAVGERLLSLTEVKRPSDGRTVIGLLGGKHWDDPVTENPRAGSSEIWSFANTTEDTHPIHIHLARFKVLDRQEFDRNIYLRSGKVVYKGTPRSPQPSDRGWKDTVRAYQDMITRVIVKFELPTGTHVPRGTKLRYVWHCHMLEHEDNEMMRPYDVIA